jgi:ligand-binding SRPBCC domain-containing protein
MSVDARIDYTIKLNGIPMRWRTRIAVWEPPTPGGTSGRFVDSQERGPYSLWWHEHRFEAVGDKTLMSDTVHYTLPLGPLGWIAHAVMVRGMLRRIFGFRYQAMRARFGIGGRAPETETRPTAAAA